MKTLQELAQELGTIRHTLFTIRDHGDEQLRVAQELLGTVQSILERHQPVITSVGEEYPRHCTVCGAKRTTDYHLQHRSYCPLHPCNSKKS